MCAIAGLTTFSDENVVARMLDRLRHRGPDGIGVWSDLNNGVTLGCSRLATTDPSDVANQPLQTADGRFVLVFNGYIAGHRRKIAKASKDGLPVQSQNDAELVLHLLTDAVLRGGEISNVLASLSGQYALALWDKLDQRLWLARDPLGIKPLYVMHLPSGGIAFASEPSGLSAITPLEPDTAIKPQYLSHLFVPAPKSGLVDVELLAAGTMLSWQSGSIKRSKIPHPAHNVKPHRADDRLVAELRKSVRQSVADAMDADRNVGCLVSGGLDSAGVSAMACDIARERGERPPVAFVMGFDNPERDETQAAQRLCRHVGQELHVFKAPTNPEDIHAGLLEGLKSIGAPFANPSLVLMRALAKQVSAHVPVCLSGDGGDELFGGYPRYRAARLYDRYWRRLPALFRRIGGSLGTRITKRNLGRFLRGAAGGREDAFAAWNDRCAIPELLAQLDVLNGNAASNGDLVDDMMQFDRDVTLPGNQLLMSDRCGMAFGLEYRLPLLGHDVVRLAASVSGKAHLRGGAKAIWRQEIAPYLPADHIRNPKIGFNPPVADWLRDVAAYRWGDEERIINAVFAETDVATPRARGYWKRAVSGRDLDMSLTVWALMVWQIWLALDDSEEPQSDARVTADVT
ncbi:MAG: asparagine synthase (glutamine-hydrolyzing) [Thalassospira sp.]|uniref:asparagine synthase (glutamine-hydrolyzing) n=1 Tax=Thalassospira sp. TaxID=1912094 RepID=UPI003A8C5B33